MRLIPPYFRWAKKASKNSDHRIKVGACIILNRKPISVGFNQRFKAHTIIRQFHDTQTIHAEVHAILNVKNKKLLEGSTLIVYRENNMDGELALARPCKPCQEFIKLFKIKKVVYTTDGGYTEELFKNEEAI